MPKGTKLTIHIVFYAFACHLDFLTFNGFLPSNLCRYHQRQLYQSILIQNLLLHLAFLDPYQTPKASLVIKHNRTLTIDVACVHLLKSSMLMAGASIFNFFNYKFK